MPLEKDMMQPTGVTAAYHRITRVSIDMKFGTTTLDVSSYLDAAAQRDNKTPITGFSATVDAMPPGLEDWATAALKSRSEMQGAKDAV